MKRAVILAGGRGTRLRPYTVSLPKPLMPVVDAPILEIIVKQLAARGFERITLAVNHQAELFKAYFTDGSKWGIRIDYSLETEPLSTMGPLRLIPDLPHDFLVMNGDVLTDLDFAAFLAQHVEERRDFSISAFHREEKIDYGVLHAGADGTLSGFEEKPTVPYLVSMGVYAMSSRILPLIVPGRPFGFDHLMAALLARSQPVHVRPHTGYWLDIGRPDDYERAIEEWPRISEKIT
jgi:NDP-sugar pyrophosphorylase family protein